MSPQLSLQIQMLFKECNNYFCQIEKSLTAKNNKLGFSNLQAGSGCEDTQMCY